MANKATLSALRTSVLTLGAAGVALCALSLGGIARAQDESGYSDAPEQVIVHSPYYERHMPVNRPNDPGMRDPERITLSRAVPFDDLDLTRRSGVMELKRRIGFTANDVCNELRHRYPKTGLYVYDYDDCALTARKNAMRVADRIIDDANR